MAFILRAKPWLVSLALRGQYSADRDHGPEGLYLDWNGHRTPNVNDARVFGNWCYAERVRLHTKGDWEVVKRDEEIVRLMVAQA